MIVASPCVVKPTKPHRVVFRPRTDILTYVYVSNILTQVDTSGATMTTPLTLPVTEIEDAVDYYGNLLGVEARWNSSSEAVLSIPSEETDLHLVAARPEAVLRALDDGSLDVVVGSLWRMTGGWTVAPGKGGVCCQACGQPVAPPPGISARMPLQRLARHIRRQKTTPTVNESTWSNVGDSPLISRSALGVLRSASVRKIAVSWTRETEYGVRVSFAHADLPDVLLVGASQTPPPGSVLEVPILEGQAVTIPFQSGRRRRVLVACDRIRLS